LSKRPYIKPAIGLLTNPNQFTGGREAFCLREQDTRNYRAWAMRRWKLGKPAGPFATYFGVPGKEWIDALSRYHG